MPKASVVRTDRNEFMKTGFSFGKAVVKLWAILATLTCARRRCFNGNDSLEISINKNIESSEFQYGIRKAKYSIAYSWSIWPYV
jgi:hypothetical protein